MTLNDRLKAFFTEDAFSLMAVPLQPRYGETTFPGAIRLEAQSEEEDGKIAEALKIDLGTNGLPIIFTSAGFMPTAGQKYECVLRKGKGNMILAFPRKRHLLRAKNEWAPHLFFIQDKITMVKNGQGFSGRHPGTGQRVIPAKGLELPDGNKDGTIVVPMTGLALKPVLTSSIWILDKTSELERAGEAGFLALYDDEVAVIGRKAIKEDYECAREFKLLGKRTVFEIAGSPLGPSGKPAGSIEELEANGKDWLDQLERWMRRNLTASIHDDYKSYIPDNLLTENNLKQARLVAAEIRENSATALDWARGWLKETTDKLRRRRANGLSVRFAIPIPKGYEPLPGPPLIALTNGELREMFVGIVTGTKPVERSATQSPVKKTDVVKTDPKVKNPTGTTAKNVKADKPEQPVKTGTKRRTAPAARGGMATIAEQLEQKGLVGTKKEAPAIEKKLSRNVPCPCGKSHVRPEGFTKAKFKTCPKAGKTTK